MYNIIALVGEAGSGKDFLLRQLLLENNDLHKIVHSTTRPKRQGEKDGVHYHYYDVSTFLSIAKSGLMSEWRCFNGWYYGTEDSVLEPAPAVNVGVFSPGAVRDLMLDCEYCVKVYRICASDKNRLLRQIDREDDPNINEIVRRFNSDSEDFKRLGFSYQSLSNNTMEELRQSLDTIQTQVPTLFG